MVDENLEKELASALGRRIEVIGDRALRESDPERQLAELREVSERIAELQARLPATVHPQLRHYFERCSYDKALEWIEREGLTGSMR
jgi:flagellar motility protein MotE (MotC chaperone)